MTSKIIGEYVIGSKDSSWHYLILSMDAMRKYNIQSNPQLDEHYKKLLEKAEKYDGLKITIMPKKFTESQKEFIQLRQENKQLKEIVEKMVKRIEETKDYDIYLLVKEGVTKNSAKFVTNRELKEILATKEQK